jgi:hypothetical protein
MMAHFIQTDFVELRRGLDRPTPRSVVLVLIHSIVAEGFESFLRRILAEPELEFSKGESSQKTTNQRLIMRHVHHQTRKNVKAVSRIQHCQL